MIGTMGQSLTASVVNQGSRSKKWCKLDPGRKHGVLTEGDEGMMDMKI